MFFAAPVKDAQENIIAVVTQRVDPAIDFTRLIQLGRIGKSGETYALSRYGKLLSESRFEDDLRKAGLLWKNENSILLISARDPGGDLTKGYSASVPRYQQPLTLTAREASKGKSGVNVEGYRDYRCVPVYGAWLWDDKHGDVDATTHQEGFKKGIRCSDEDTPDCEHNCANRTAGGEHVDNNRDQDKKRGKLNHSQNQH